MPTTDLISRKGYPGEDPLGLLSDLLTRANTTWLRLTYPFAGFGTDVSIHYSCDVPRSISNRIQIGNDVYFAPETWLSLPERAVGRPPAIILGNRCKIGRRCMFSAKNRIELEDDVLFGPSVLVTDHSHEFSEINTPIHAQGLTAGGTVRIERNCWLSYGAAVICSSGELVIGRNSVVGANAVVTRSVPPFSVVAGNPAKILKHYDPDAREWVKASKK